MVHLNLYLQNDRLTGVLSGAHVVNSEFSSVVKNRITLWHKLFFYGTDKNRIVNRDLYLDLAKAYTTSVA